MGGGSIKIAAKRIHKQSTLGGAATPRDSVTRDLGEKCEGSVGWGLTVRNDDSAFAT